MVFKGSLLEILVELFAKKDVRNVTWFKHKYYENVLPEPDITTGITKKYRERYDISRTYTGNSKAFYEHIDLDDDKDEGKSIPDHVEIIQGDIYDYEDDDAV